jgi:hypothetical protein
MTMTMTTTTTLYGVVLRSLTFEVPEDASGFDGDGDHTLGRHDDGNDDDEDDLGHLQKLLFLAGQPYSEAAKTFGTGERRGQGLILPAGTARDDGALAAAEAAGVDRDLEEEMGNGPPSMPRRQRACHGRAFPASRPPPPSGPERGGIGMCRGTGGGGGASSPPDPSAGAAGPESIAVVSGAVGSPAAAPSEAGQPSGVTRVDREERPPHIMQRKPPPSRHQWGRDRVASESSRGGVRVRAYARTWDRGSRRR